MKLADIPGAYQVTDEWYEQPTVRVSSLVYGKIHNHWWQFLDKEPNVESLRKNHMGVLHLDEGIFHIVIYKGT